VSVTVIPYWGAWVAGLILLLVLLLLDLAHHGLVARFDDWAFAHLAHQPHNRFWNLVAWIGEPWAVVTYVLIMAGALLVDHEEQLAMWVLWTLGFGNILGIITKKLLKRERPGDHLEHDNGYSFPSGHVLGSTILYLIVVELWPTWPVMIIGGVAWLLVAGSRLFLRAHHVSDVGGTILFTGAWFIISTVLYQLIFD
jgi:membrane-associated phospholipid phosphatase